jgi:dTDP-4-amino-4,6-dideoxygalactose transaminase
MNKIQVLKPRYRVDECLLEIKECLDIGWTGMGFKTIEFENQWKTYTGLAHAHFLNSATAGLHLAIKILKDKYCWNDKSEVITTPFTFISTNHAIKYENLTPCFADIDDSLNLDPESVKARINENTKAIVFVGIGGNTQNLLDIIQIARSNDIKIILDAAHMAGSRISGQHIGFDVDVSVFSFQAVKNLPTSDSGMVCFNNKEDDKKARELSWLGIDKDTFGRSGKGSYKWDYAVNGVGYKYHGNSIAAALGIVGLKYLDKDNQYRRDLAERYVKNLDGKIKYIKHESGQTSRHLFQVVVENRDSVIEYLATNNIYPGVHYRANNEYSVFYVGEIFERSQYYSDRILSLPMHLELEIGDIDQICEVLLKSIDIEY